MEPELQQAYGRGFERLVGWADLLDDINVFPVADSDTGRNMVLTLSPLRSPTENRQDLIKRIWMSARGNAGKIAAGFFSGFLTAEKPSDFEKGAREGRDRAVECVAVPRRGTMLTVLDALADVLRTLPAENRYPPSDAIVDRMQEAVLSTKDSIPRLKSASVVDSGALGMFLFLEGFFNSLAGKKNDYRNIMETFTGCLTVSGDFREKEEAGYCVDAVIGVDGKTGEAVDRLFKSAGYEEVVAFQEKDYVKLHFHVKNTEYARTDIESMGRLLRWSEDDIAGQMESGKRTRGRVHIMTDAAGSVRREEAAELGMTLLSSYITVDTSSLPEIYVNPSDMYRALRDGKRVYTSQASVFERHNFYQSAVQRFETVLYICVGSVYTGNFEVASKWKRERDVQNKMMIIDTGLASGKLGIVATETAKYALKTEEPEKVFRFAGNAVSHAGEFVFLDRLAFLAKSGRMSRPGAVFADLVGLRPVITPTPAGAKKIGLVKNLDGQLNFALKGLFESFPENSRPLIWLQYSDNRELVEKTIFPRIAKEFPGADIRLVSLSLTSGAHMGPGTWALAFLPEPYTAARCF